MINIFQPSLGSEEVEAVRKVFESNWIGKGKLTDQFEEKFAEHLKAPRKNIRSISCCTEGLFQSMELLRIKPGDEVILPTVSFVGAGNAVAAAGARPVFCDVDPRTLNATPETIERKITSKTKAVMILHYGGHPCEMDEICALTKSKSLALIEDSACSISSSYKGKMCGTFGDTATWSFDAMKILVTGDGGMLYCSNPEMAQEAEELAYLGLTSESGFSNACDTKWWEFEISRFGRRAIVNDVTSAIGLVQLQKLSGFIARRKEIHEYYDRELRSLGWLKLPPALGQDKTSSYYFYWMQMPEKYRDELAMFLRKNGVYTTFRYYPLHLVRHYDSPENLPEAEKAARSTLCIPIHQSLSDSDLAEIVGKIAEFGRNFL